MAEINKINVGGTTYDVRDASAVRYIEIGTNNQWIEINPLVNSWATGGYGSQFITQTIRPMTYYKSDTPSIGLWNGYTGAGLTTEGLEFFDAASGLGGVGMFTYSRVDSQYQARDGGEIYFKSVAVSPNGRAPMIKGYCHDNDGPAVEVGNDFSQLRLFGSSVTISATSLDISGTTTLGTRTAAGNFYPGTPSYASKYILPTNGKFYYVKNGPNCTTTETITDDLELLTLGTLKNSTNSTELTVSASNPTLSFGSEHTIGWVGGVELKVTMPNNTSSSDTKVKVTTGNTTKAYVLGVNSSGYSSGSATDKIITDTGVYLNTTSGQIAASTFWATSDKRLKENITPYSCDKSILDLPVYKYNFIKDPDKLQHIGCLAQDLQEICPEAVFTEDDGYLVINESKLVYLLLDEVKKLKQEIVGLKKGN